RPSISCSSRMFRTPMSDLWTRSGARSNGRSWPRRRRDSKNAGSTGFAPSPTSATSGSSPLLNPQVLLRRPEFLKYEVLGELNEGVRAARVEDRAQRILPVLPHPVRGDASVMPCPRVVRGQARAGDVKDEPRIDSRHLLEFRAEDDVRRSADTVQERDPCLELA